MLDRKMAIFGYQRVQYPISRQRIRIKQREMGTNIKWVLTLKWEIIGY